MYKDNLAPGQVVNHSTHGNYIYLATDGRWFFFTRGLKVREEELCLFDLVERDPLEEVHIGVEPALIMSELMLESKRLNSLVGGEVIIVNENFKDMILIVKSVDLELGLITCTNGISYDTVKHRIYYTGHHSSSI